MEGSSETIVLLTRPLYGIAVADVNGDTLADLIVSGNSTANAGYLGRVGVFLQDPVKHTLGALSSTLYP